jgi:hypothetical protein
VFVFGLDFDAFEPRRPYLVTGTPVVKDPLQGAMSFEAVTSVARAPIRSLAAELPIGERVRQGGVVVRVVSANGEDAPVGFMVQISELPAEPR